MKKYIRIALLVLASIAVLQTQTFAGTLSGAGLTVNIRNDNGAIDNLQFQEYEFFELGAHVSDYGFQNGSDTTTFALNNTYGLAGKPVTVAGSFHQGI